MHVVRLWLSIRRRSNNQNSNRPIVHGFLKSLQRLLKVHVQSGQHLSQLCFLLIGLLFLKGLPLDLLRQGRRQLPLLYFWELGDVRWYSQLQSRFASCFHPEERSQSKRLSITKVVNSNYSRSINHNLEFKCFILG